MATPPEPILLQSQDFPPSYKDLLDKLLPTVQRQIDATRVNLAAGLTRANSAGQDLQVTINTPASDWITCTLAGGFTSTDALANGFNAPRYRYANGALYFDGACEYNGGTGTTAVPVTFVTGLPILPNDGTHVNADVSGSWAEINTTGSFHSITYANAALIRYVANTGVLSFRAAGSAAPATPWGVVFLSVTCQFPTPGLVVPPLSCFPITVQTTVQNPSRVTVSQILDTTTPVPALVAASPGGLYWQAAGPGQITIANLAGLALGRTYQVSLFVES